MKTKKCNIKSKIIEPNDGLIISIIELAEDYVTIK